MSRVFEVGGLLGAIAPGVAPQINPLTLAGLTLQGQGLGALTLAQNAVMQHQQRQQRAQQMFASMQAAAQNEQFRRDQLAQQRELAIQQMAQQKAEAQALAEYRAAQLAEPPAFQQRVEYIQSLPEEQRAAALQAMGGGGVNINMPGAGQFGSIPSGYQRMLNPETGEVEERPIPGGPATELTGAQNKALDDIETMTGVVGGIADLIDEGHDPTSYVEDARGMLSLLRSEQQGQYEALTGKGTTIYGTMVSGAEVPESQRAHFERENFPQAGDKPEVARSKLRRLVRELQNRLPDKTPADAPVRKQLQALEQRFLEGGAQAGPQAGHVESGYRFKGGDPADQANWEPDT